MLKRLFDVVVALAGLAVLWPVLLVVAGIVGNYWLRPLMGLGYGFIDLLLSPLQSVFRAGAA